MTNDSLTTSLLVTGIGMAVVFVAMALFYASMHLLTALVRDKPERDIQADTGTRIEEETGPPIAASGPDRNAPLRAAAIAVALARAETSEQKTAGDDHGTTPPVSHWGDYYRQRQLRPGSRGRIA